MVVARIETSPNGGPQAQSAPPVEKPVKPADPKDTQARDQLHEDLLEAKRQNAADPKGTKKMLEDTGRGGTE